MKFQYSDKRWIPQQFMQKNIFPHSQSLCNLHSSTDLLFLSFFCTRLQTHLYHFGSVPGQDTTMYRAGCATDRRRAVSISVEFLMSISCDLPRLRSLSWSHAMMQEFFGLTFLTAIPPEDGCNAKVHTFLVMIQYIWNTEYHMLCKCTVTEL